MHTMFLSSKKIKTSDSQRLLVNLTNKINLKGNDKYVTLWNLDICYTWNNIKKSYKYNKFKISTPAWIEEFEFADRSYSVSDI